MNEQTNPQLMWPKPSARPPTKRNQNKYCRYHRDWGHTTEDCFEIKEEIEKLIRRGQLKKYLQDQVR